MNSTRLLFLSLSSTQFGGGEVYLLNLLRHFRQTHPVAVALAAENELMLTRVRELDVPYRTFSLSYRALRRTVADLAAWHRQEPFHLVHANGRRSQLFGAELARHTGLPLVGADLVAPITWSGPLWPFLKNAGAALLNRLVAEPRLTRRVVLCEFMRRESIRWLRVDPSRTVTVYNAVDPDFFAPRPRDVELARSLGIPDGAKVVVCSARFVEHKGHRLLIDALHRLHGGDRLPDFRAILIGDGPDEAPLRDRVAELGLSEHFVFMPFPPDIRPYMALGDVGVLTSREEGMPTALLQLMAMERPVIGTDTQGIPEVVASGENGWLTPLGRPDVLAEKLLHLLEHPEEAQRMGSNGRARVLANFSLRKMYADYEAVYRAAGA